MKKAAYILVLILLVIAFSVGIGCRSRKKVQKNSITPLDITLVDTPKKYEVLGVIRHDVEASNSSMPIKVEQQKDRQQTKHPSNSAHSAAGKKRIKAGLIGNATRTIKKAIKNSPLPNAGNTPATTTATGINEKTDTVLKNASLGVFCPPKMKFHETRLITVWIKVDRTKAQVVQDVKSTEKESGDWRSENDSTAILPISLQLYDSVKVSLQYDTADFTITPAVGNDGKNTKIDVKNGNLWQWNITAISKNKRSSEITLIIAPHTPPNLNLVPIPSHVIPIIIYFDFWDMIRGWIRWLGEHPEYTIPSVLVPIIVVIYKRRKKKKDDV